MIIKLNQSDTDELEYLDRNNIKNTLEILDTHLIYYIEGDIRYLDEKTNVKLEDYLVQKIRVKSNIINAVELGTRKSGDFEVNIRGGGGDIMLVMTFNDRIDAEKIYSVLTETYIK